MRTSSSKYAAVAAADVLPCLDFSRSNSSKHADTTPEQCQKFEALEVAVGAHTCSAQSVCGCCCCCVAAVSSLISSTTPDPARKNRALFLLLVESMCSAGHAKQAQLTLDGPETMERIAPVREKPTQHRNQRRCCIDVGLTTLHIIIKL
jgi:hypothetical protein